MSTETAKPEARNQLILSSASLGAMSEVPEHLRGDAGQGLEELKKFVRPGRLKVIQSNATGAYAAYDEGTVIVTPANVTVAGNDEPFYFVPLFFYPEWCTLNPYSLKAQLKMIRARTYDPMHEISIKAQDPERRGADKCPENEKFFLKHVEYLNFIVAVVCNSRVSPSPVVLSFSKGDHKVGRTLANLLAMRASTCAIYANVLQGKVPETKRVNDQGEWYGIDVTVPSGDGAPAPFVMNAEEYKELKKMSDAIKAAHKASTLIVDHEDDEAEAAEAEAKGESKF